MLAQMNTYQKQCVVFGLCLFIVAGLFPPWKIHYDLATRPPIVAVERASSYSFIWEPPYNAAGVDLGRLCVEWAMIGALTTIFCVKPPKD
jgi:hypothetical protein